MKAEVISIGDEMTSGQRLDTNSQWLSQQLADLGITTARHTTVADDLESNVEVFRSAAQRADFVISSGGLGPTLDDLTREAMALAFDRTLVLHEPSLQHIESLFARRKRAMPERNRAQAMIPSGADVVPNPHGTAPGIDLRVSKQGGGACSLFALPGVPAEMKEMWTESVMPRIVQQLGEDRKPLRFHTVKLFGIGESDVEVKLPNLIRRDRYPRVGITVSQATISLRIAAEAKDEQEFQSLIAPTLEEIHSALGSLIFANGEDDVQDAAVRELRRHGLSLAILEIGPAAWVAAAMGDACRSDASLLAGVASMPSLAHARRWQGGDDRARPSSSGEAASTAESILSLARTVREQFGADLGLAFGPYPSLGSVSGQSPGGEVTFALVGGEGTNLLETRFMGGHPDVIVSRIAKTALDLVRLELQRVS